ncbi:ubiquinol-cytochrome-c reductase complex subunit-domain-containing protein [Bombardia bombarda]|uniref:Ubiquinol-cytochrome-c reductase complex subunit-domain-containing protein n=1 Tax=Bombardia bombarda TaxID=252184 RepID=A0AA39X9D6_9PEZI|nr:ubiquinol-cytochrome-c reductase complex subunit-domain-containing protein [Bombardia bombarda]
MPFASPILRAVAQKSPYKSPYGPKYHYIPNFGGITAQSLFRFVPTAAGFGSVALVAVLFLTSGIPRIQNDILKKLPFVTPYYEKNIPASDNPF